MPNRGIATPPALPNASAPSSMWEEYAHPWPNDDLAWKQEHRYGEDPAQVPSSCCALLFCLRPTTRQKQHIKTRLNHTGKSLGGEGLWKLGASRSPCPAPLACAGPAGFPGSQPHWGVASAPRPARLVLTHCFPMAPPGGDFRLHGLCVPTPNRSLQKGAPAQCRPGSHQNRN